MILDYDQWLSENEEELSIYASESGCDRELDYDWYRFLQHQYDGYLCKKITNNDFA